MKYVLTGLILLATCPAFADLQSDMINDRLDRLDREMTLIQKKIYTIPMPRSDSEIRPEKPTNLDEVYTQLDEQNRLLGELTRKVEELTHNQDLLKEELRQMRTDTDIRFQETKPAQPIPDSKPVSAKSTDKEAYDRAYNLLIKAKYPEAEQAFRSFLADYPQSSLVGNANYWLGETYYVRGQYEIAAGIFSDGLTKYQSSTKAPDNLLKLGLTMSNLGKTEEACGFFKLLPEQFPKSSATLKQRAVQEAKKLSCP